jgi:hypothetical protein
MTNNEILQAAEADGFELEERPLANAWVCGWARGDDSRWPCYLERDQALRWMADRMRRVRVFA